MITNDRDFLDLADEYDHAGIVLYTDRSWLATDPVSAAQAVVRIDRFYGPDDRHNAVEWLDNWR